MAAIAQIIKYEGDNNTFVWKHPIEDFNTATQLIVHQSQEAVFYMNGQALDVLGPGRHTLETQNIPIISGILRRPTGIQTPFHCEVYFINKTEQLIHWGTNKRVQYQDPQYKFPLEVGAAGDMFVRVQDSRRLLDKLVGTELFLGKLAMTQFFQSFVRAQIIPCLARTMQDNTFTIFEVDAHMDSIAYRLHELLQPIFASYGIGLERFFITNFVKPEEDEAYKRHKELFIRSSTDIRDAELRQQVGIIEQQTEAQKKLIESEALAKKRKQEGYNYQQERGYDVLDKLGENEGVGNFSNAGVGLGMMGGMAGGMGAAIAGLTAQALDPITSGFNQDKRQRYQTQGDSGYYGAPPPIELDSDSPSAQHSEDVDNFRERLEKLKAMKEQDIISAEEYEIKRREILNNL